MKSRSTGKLVYSTDSGRHCDGCGQPRSSCICNDSSRILGDGKVRVRRENKGRGGKTVTLITGLPMTADELKAACKTLKQLCGGGGSVQEGTVEVQGDQVEKVLQWLLQKGYDARRSGG